MLSMEFHDLIYSNLHILFPTPGYLLAIFYEHRKAASPSNTTPNSLLVMKNYQVSEFGLQILLENLNVCFHIWLTDRHCCIIMFPEYVLSLWNF